MQETAYCEGVRSIYELCLHALLLIEQAGGRARMALGVVTCTAHSRNKEMRKLFSKAADAYAEASGSMLGYWKAWQEFCEVAEVNPEAVIRAVQGDLPKCIVDPLLPYVAESIEPDPDAKAKALELFMERWRIYRERTGARTWKAT